MVTPGHGRANIKRVELLRFSGKVKDYWEFREVFRSLLEELNNEHLLYITQLKNQLTSEGRSMLRGVVDRDEAWEVLSQHYGNRDATVVTTFARLRHLRLSGASSHDKVEALAQAVQQATTSLRHMGAEALLASDLTIIGCLVIKLPPNYVSWWDDHTAKAGGDLGPVQGVVDKGSDNRLGGKNKGALQPVGVGAGRNKSPGPSTGQAPTYLARSRTNCRKTGS